MSSVIIEDNKNKISEYELGIKYLNNNEYDEAITYFKLAIKNNNNANLKLADIYYDLSKFDLSELYYLNFLHASFDDVNYGYVYNCLGYVYLKLNNNEKSELYYLKAINKNYYDAYVSLGLYYFNIEKYELSEMYYLIAIENNIYESYNNLGILYVKTNKNDMAIKMFKNGIKYLNDSNALINLGDLYVNNKQYNKGEKYYLKAVKENNKLGIPKLENLSNKRLYYLLSDMDDNDKEKNNDIDKKIKKIKHDEYINNKTVIFQDF